MGRCVCGVDLSHLINRMTTHAYPPPLSPCPTGANRALWVAVELLRRAPVMRAWLQADRMGNEMEALLSTKLVGVDDVESVLPEVVWRELPPSDPAHSKADAYAARKAQLSRAMEQMEEAHVQLILCFLAPPVPVSVSAIPGGVPRSSATFFRSFLVRTVRNNLGEARDCGLQSLHLKKINPHLPLQSSTAP